MLNWFAKLLLVSTALSPILGAVAVNQLALKRPWTSWVPWLAVAVLLAVICWGLLRHAAKNAQKQTVKITEFERRDTEVLAFLLAYLLPFIAAKDMAFTGDHSRCSRSTQMSEIGKPERETQRRVIALLGDELGYCFLGDWHDRDGNNIVAWAPGPWSCAVVPLQSTITLGGGKRGFPGANPLHTGRGPMLRGRPR